MKIDNKLILEHSKNLTVLYVEDDEILRESTSRIFSKYFKSVEIAINGEDGLDKYIHYNANHGFDYDIVITDINMPKMDGLAMSEYILTQNIDQAIIIITAHNENNFLLKAINMGVNGFLIKPLDSEQLKIQLYKVAQAVADKKSLNHYYLEMEKLNDGVF